jgi:hypothetical protein
MSGVSMRIEGQKLAALLLAGTPKIRARTEVTRRALTPSAAIGCTYEPHLPMAELTKHSKHRDVDLVAAQFDALDSDTQAGSAGGDSRARRHRRLIEVLSATSAIAQSCDCRASQQRALSPL